MQVRLIGRHTTASLPLAFGPVLALADGFLKHHRLFGEGLVVAFDRHSKQRPRCVVTQLPQQVPGFGFPVRQLEEPGNRGLIRPQTPELNDMLIAVQEVLQRLQSSSMVAIGMGFFGALTNCLVSTDHFW